MSAPTLAQDQRDSPRQPVRIDFSDRASRRRRLLRRALGVLAILAVAGMVWIVWSSSLFSVTTVRVVGVDGTPVDAVLSAAAVPVGLPLARIDTGAAEVAVMALPWVSSVEVRRGWPHEIVVAVKSRAPIAVLSVDGTQQAVDAMGVVFDAPGPMPRGLPTVSIDRADGVGLEAAMQVLAALPADIAGRVNTLSATTRDNVDLVFKSGVKVHWGSAEQTDAKAEVLRALMRRKADVYDVTAPELPTTFTAR